MNLFEDRGYLTYLAELEQINGMPKGLLPRIMAAESGGDPKALGPKRKGAHAQGAFQFMPGTAKEVGVDPWDPIEAAGGAAIYLRRLHNQFGDWGKAVAAYNAGPGNIKKGIYPTETKNYVAKVFGESPPTPKGKTSILGELTGGFKEAIGGMAGGALRFPEILGFEGTRETAAELERWAGEAAPTREYSILKDPWLLLDPEYLARQVGRAGGALASLAPALALGGGAPAALAGGALLSIPAAGMAYGEARARGEPEDLETRLKALGYGALSGAASRLSLSPLLSTASLPRRAATGALSGTAFGVADPLARAAIFEQPLGPAAAVGVEAIPQMALLGGLGGVAGRAPRAVAGQLGGALAQAGTSRAPWQLQRGAIGDLDQPRQVGAALPEVPQAGADVPQPPQRTQDIVSPPSPEVSELTALRAERDQVKADITRLSRRNEAMLTNSDTRRLGELNNDLAALDQTIERLGGGASRPALEQIAQALNDAPAVREVARRGRQSWAETEAAAQALRGERLPELARITGATPKDLDSVMRRNIGEAYNAEHIDNAAHHLKTQWASDAQFYKEMAEKIRAGTFADNDIINSQERILSTTALNAQYSGIAAEAGRALRIFRKTKQVSNLNQMVQAALSKPGTRLLSLGSNTPLEFLKAKIEALATLDPDNATQGIQAQRRLFEANRWDKFYEALYASVLSGIPTHVANVTGNLGVQLFEDIARFGAALKPWRGDVTLREAASHLSGWLGGTFEGLKAFGHVMRTENQFGLFEREGTTRAIKGLKGKLIRLPLRFLAAEDAFFKALTLAKERNALATREHLRSGLPRERYLDIATPEGKDIEARAMREAERRTFTNPGGAITKAIETMRSSHPLLRPVMLFVRTPANIMKMTLQNSPLGVLFKDVRADLAKPGAARDIAVARMAAGTGIGLLSYLLAEQELITGAAPEDPAERDLFYQSGRVPYAWKAGNQWVPYRRWEPFATYLGAVADARTIFKQSPLTEDQERDMGDYVTAVIGGIASNFSDKTFMRSLTDFAEAWSDPGRFMENYAGNIAGLAVPTIVAHAAKAQDPYLREANGIMDRVRMKIPGQRQQLPRKVSALGEFVMERGTPFERMTSPFIPSGFRDDPLVEELLRLKKGIGVQERTKHKTILGKQYDVELPDDVYELLATTRGRVLRTLLTAVINSPGYQSKPDYDRAYLMDKILIKAKRKVGRALDKGLEGEILRLALEQNPDILDIKVPGRPPAAP
jgi:Transglycosylase SLT domain